MSQRTRNSPSLPPTPQWVVDGYTVSFAVLLLYGVMFVLSLYLQRAQGYAALRQRAPREDDA
jgi:hypothetical protein